MKTKINLKELSEENLTLFIEKLGQKPYRARQIIKWIYKNLVSSIDEMSNLSINFREELKERSYISNLKLLNKKSSKDGSQKFLFGLEDGESIESVFIPDENRLTLCISSQVGCRMGCRFCNTGLLGLKRNLKAYEITDQILSVIRLIRNEDKDSAEKDRRRITNIVLMGMGEPLDNIQEVQSALLSIIDNTGISKKRITLSTAGIIPGIRVLAEKGPDVNLAISLNAATDRVRNMIMPINKRYPLKDLISACREYTLPPSKKITFEYVLLDGINDSEKDSIRLLKLLNGIQCKVNLIPYNQAPNRRIKEDLNFRGKQVSGKGLKTVSFSKPADEKILRFQKVLQNAGIATIIRKSRGTDISAACGQLKADYNKTGVRG